MTELCTTACIKDEEQNVIPEKVEDILKVDNQISEMRFKNKALTYTQMRKEGFYIHRSKRIVSTSSCLALHNSFSYLCVKIRSFFYAVFLN